MKKLSLVLAVLAMAPLGPGPAAASAPAPKVNTPQEVLKALEYLGAEKLDDVRRFVRLQYKAWVDQSAALKKKAKVGWSTENVLALPKVIQAAGGAVAALHRSNPSAVGDAYGTKLPAGWTGALTNIEESGKAVFKLFKYDMPRGCKAHQNDTFNGVRAPAKAGGLRACGITVTGHPWTDAVAHEAVVVWPAGRDYGETGLVLDGWLEQTSKPRDMVFTIERWLRLMKGLKLGNVETCRTYDNKA